MLELGFNLTYIASMGHKSLVLKDLPSGSLLTSVIQHHALADTGRGTGMLSIVSSSVLTIPSSDVLVPDSVQRRAKQQEESSGARKRRRLGSPR